MWKALSARKERNSISNFIICLLSRWCSWHEAEEEKLFPSSAAKLRVCEARRANGMKNHNKKQKEKSTSVPSCPFVVVSSSFSPEHTEKDLLNIKVQYSRWCREPTPAWRARENRCARLLCTIWLLLCAFSRSYSENCEWKSFLSRSCPLSLLPSSLAAYLSHEHRVRRFSVNRKTFLSFSRLTLTYPMQVCFQPRRRFIFPSESRLWEMCVRSQTRRT